MALPMRNTLVSARVPVAVIGLILAVSLLAGAQQGQPGKPASQVYKNLKILNDIPSEQLLPSMRFISTALGVECEFCHTGTRSEDTPNKEMGRKMLVMMLALDKSSFDGRLDITCFTCHRGSINPVVNPTPTGQYSAQGPIAFFTPAVPPAGGGDEVMAEAYRDVTSKQQAAEAAAMPKPEQILAKYVEALGGAQAIQKVTSRAITAFVEMAPNVRGTGIPLYGEQVQYYKAPNLYVATFQRLNAPQTAKGFDGKDAWTQTANGAVNSAVGTALDRARRDADFYEPLNLTKEYTRLSVRGIEKVRDRDAYLVVGVPNGDQPERLYFDVKTGLLLRKYTVIPTAVGYYPTQVDYDDYRDVSGVKVPYLINALSISPADTMTIRVSKVENNPAGLDDSKFTKPAPKPAKPPAGQ
jgi:hypothetical protein